MSRVDKFYDIAGNRLFLTTAEQQTLIAHLVNADALMQRYVLTVLHTGARVHELTSISHAGLLDGNLTFGDPARTVPVCKAFAGVLEDATAPLFPLHRTTVWRQLKPWFQSAGIDGLAANMDGLRMSFAMNALKAGVSLPRLSEWLGHKNITTTAKLTLDLQTPPTEDATRLLSFYTIHRLNPHRSSGDEV